MLYFIMKKNLNTGRFVIYCSIILLKVSLLIKLYSMVRLKKIKGIFYCREKNI